MLNKKITRGLVAAAFVLATLPSGSALFAGSSTFTVDEATLLNFLRAVTPYEFVVGQGGLSETLRLSNPREIKFENGHVSMKIDCRGEPFPIETVLEPQVGVAWDEAQQAWVAKLLSLPLAVEPLGTTNLARYVRAVPIPSVFSQLAGDDQVGFILDGRITHVGIADGKIQVVADLTFRQAPPPLAPSSSAAPAPTTRR